MVYSQNWKSILIILFLISVQNSALSQGLNTLIIALHDQNKSVAQFDVIYQTDTIHAVDGKVQLDQLPTGLITVSVQYNRTIKCYNICLRPDFPTFCSIHWNRKHYKKQPTLRDNYSICL